MDNLKIFKTNSAKVDIEKIKETNGSFMGFFTNKAKKNIIDVCLYKSEAIFALSDAYIITFDILRECQILEINEIHKNEYNLLQIKIVHQIENYFPNEMLLCLCEKNLILMDLENYLIKVNIELKQSALKAYLEYINDSYKIIIIHKYSVTVYDIKIIKQIIKLNKIIEIDNIELITNKNMLYTNNLLMFETKNFINVYKFDYNSPFYSKKFSINKREISIYKIDIVMLETKSNDLSKHMSFNYSKITNMFYLTITNKIYLLKNSYSPLFTEEFEITEKLTKQSNINLTIIDDPYILIFIDSKVYVYFIQDLNKCIEIVELNSSFINFYPNMIYTKEIDFLFKIGKINLESNLIQYTDYFHLKSLKFKSPQDKEVVLNSCQMIYMFFNTKNMKLEWIYSTNLQNQIRFLKGVNPNFSSTILSHFTKQNFNLKNTPIKNVNDKYLLKRSLELFCFMISTMEYPKAKFCQEETLIDSIYLIMLFRNFLPSKSLKTIIYYLYISIILKYYTYDEELNEQIFLDETLEKEFEELNSVISLALIKNDKEFSLFLKTFFNKFITYRNECKNKSDKEKLKKMNLDNLIDKLSEIYNEEENFDVIKKNYFTIRNMFINNNISENELKYAIIENVVFIFYFYSFRLSRNHKYTDNLKLMIKVSHNILDKELISLLKLQNLEEEILLFHYYKGNYAKCINNIITIYESLGKDDSLNNNENEYFEDSSIYKQNTSETVTYNEDNDSVNKINLGISSTENTRNLEKIKDQWLNRYINLVTTLSEKLSNMEFYEYIKWALSKNPFRTIDILFENNKLSKEILDLDFINLLKNYGIDTVIFYLKIFLKNNDTSNTLHHNEMINLYTIKLKLLQEAIEKECKLQSNADHMTSQFYKWNKKIFKTREEFCNYLIDHKLYNLEYAYEKISLISSLQLEIGIVLVKQNKIEEGIYKIFYDDFPSKIKVLKRLITAIPIFEIVYLTLKYIITNYSKNPNDLYKYLNTNSNEISLEMIIIDILEVFKKDYNLILVFNLKIFIRK